jgi:hypothetical protein
MEEIMKTFLEWLNEDKYTNEQIAEEHRKALFFFFFFFVAYI